MEQNIINVYVTKRGIRRVLSCDYDGQNEVDIIFELSKPDQQVYNYINLNRKEALCLLFELLRQLLPGSFLIKKKNQTT